MTRDTINGDTSPLLSGSAAATIEEEIAEVTTIVRQYGTVTSDSEFSKAPAPSRIGAFIYDNRGLFFLFTAQLFGGIMGMLTRYLATSLPSGQRYHALQILFARMSITWLCCMIWMWWNKVPHMPLGEKRIRGLLMLRGCSGFMGVFGLYYSLSYLPLPDATVITFLVPTVLSFICSNIPSLNEPFTTQEKIGGLVSLIGVILIARPTFIFNSGTAHNTTMTFAPVKPPYVSPHQRTVAVAVALIGVLGAATAYTTIRVIGKRAHPLISVSYFASLTTIISLIGLLAIPSVGGMLFPNGLLEWGLLIAIGISGFLLQFLLTKGLQLEKAGRAVSLVYTQMIWAVVFEWLVWGNAVSGLSLIGAVLILCGAGWVNWQKWRGANKEDGKETIIQSVGGKSIEGSVLEVETGRNGLCRGEA